MEFTHVTQDGMLVELTGQDQDGLTAQVLTRTGRQLIVSPDDLHLIDSQGAEDALAAVGLRTAQAGQEEDSFRVTLANWAQVQDNARKVLVGGIAEVLGRGGLDMGARHLLEEALANAGEELAKFRP